MSTINYVEIIHNVVSELNTTITGLANSIGENKVNLYQITAGKNGISNRMATKIVEKYPQISKEYLLTGKGEPKWTASEALSKVQNIDEEIYKEISILSLKVSQLQRDMAKILAILEK